MSQDTPSNGYAPIVSPGFDGRLARLAANATTAEGFLWIVVGATLLLDVGLTALGLRMGLTEANPIAATLVERHGVVVALVGLKVAALCIGLLGWGVAPRAHRGLVPLGLALPWTVVAVINAVTIAAHAL